MRTCRFYALVTTSIYHSVREKLAKPPILRHPSTTRTLSSSPQLIKWAAHDPKTKIPTPERTLSRKRLKTSSLQPRVYLTITAGLTTSIEGGRRTIQRLVLRRRMIEEIGMLRRRLVLEPGKSALQKLLSGSFVTLNPPCYPKPESSNHPYTASPLGQLASIALKTTPQTRHFIQPNNHHSPIATILPLREIKLHHPRCF